MNVYEIQSVVLDSLTEAQVPRVFRATIYSLSKDAVEPGWTGKIDVNIVLAQFLASYDEFLEFRGLCKQRKVWVDASWKEQRGSNRFIYTVHAYEITW